MYRWYRGGVEKCLPSLGCLSILIRGLPPSCLARLTCECNRHSVVVTVFGFSSFNGDLNKWDVAKVTKMAASKSIRVVELGLVVMM